MYPKVLLRPLLTLFFEDEKIKEILQNLMNLYVPVSYKFQMAKLLQPFPPLNIGTAQS